MRRALEYAKPLGLTIAQGAEHVALSGDAQMHEGEWSSRLGLAGAPAESEEIMVMRDIALARLTGGRVHFQTLSTAGAFAIIGAASGSGLPVSAEVASHHLALCDANLAGYDTNLKVTPPLRSAGDARAAASAVAAGRVDVIVSDHTPHSSDRKDRPFDQAEPGSVGLETALSVALTSGLDINSVLRAMSWRPAELIGIGSPGERALIPGAPADICVIDPNETYVASVASMATNGTNSAVEGVEMTGRVRTTFVGGQLVVDQGKVMA